MFHVSCMSFFIHVSRLHKSFMNIYAHTHTRLQYCGGGCEIKFISLTLIVTCLLYGGILVLRHVFPSTIHNTALISILEITLSFLPLFYHWINFVGMYYLYNFLYHNSNPKCHICLYFKLTLYNLLSWKIYNLTCLLSPVLPLMFYCILPTLLL